MSGARADIMEGHYLETFEGLFFAVKGLVHPPDRFLAALRYAPDPTGERQEGGRRYRRLYDPAEQTQLLQEAYPHYLSFDPVVGATLQSVPDRCLRQVYDPRSALQALAVAGSLDAVERDAVALARLLQHEAHIPLADLGLSGSVLIGRHTPHSDLDLAVYGSQSCRAVHGALRALLDSASAGLGRLDEGAMRDLYASRGAAACMSYAAFWRSESNKVIQGLFRGRPYFIRFLKAPAESGERYGERRYLALGRAAVEAVVADAQEAIFTPCLYRVEGARLLAGPKAAAPAEIVSYRGRFCEQAREGDRVRACGTIERVEAEDGRVWQRLLLGNHHEDCLLTLS